MERGWGCSAAATALTLGQFGAAIAQMVLLITTDSSFAHITLTLLLLHIMIPSAAMRTSFLVLESDFVLHMHSACDKIRNTACFAAVHGRHRGVTVGI